MIGLYLLSLLQKENCIRQSYIETLIVYRGSEFVDMLLVFKNLDRLTLEYKQMDTTDIWMVQNNWNYDFGESVTIHQSRVNEMMVQRFI